MNIDEDIDGPAFLELSETDIRSLASKLGIVEKIMRLQKVRFTYTYMYGYM